MNRGKDVILVTGATGQQGGAVAKELLAKGHKVRAMTRKPDAPNAKALASKGAEIVKGDFDDAASVAAALKGAWGAFAVQNTWEAGVEKEEVQGRAFVQAAKKAGLAHLVYTSVASADKKTGIPHFDNKGRIEEAVRSAGLASWTILRPVFFMDNWVGPWFKPGIEQGKVMIGIKPQTKLQQIAVKDIGRFGLAAFEKHAELKGQAIDLAGDEKTGPETAAVFSKAWGFKLEFVPVPIAEVRKMSADYAIMLEWFDQVGYSVDVAALGQRFGFKPLTLEQWAAKAKVAVPARA